MAEFRVKTNAMTISAVMKTRRDRIPDAALAGAVEIAQAMNDSIIPRAVPESVARTVVAEGLASRGQTLARVSLKNVGDKPLFKWYINGTKDHDIDAVNKPDLWFYWTNKGRWFRGPHVNHPGAKAHEVAKSYILEQERQLARLAWRVYIGDALTGRF